MEKLKALTHFSADYTSENTLMVKQSLVKHNVRGEASAGGKQKHSTIFARVSKSEYRVETKGGTEQTQVRGAGASWPCVM